MGTLRELEIEGLEGVMRGPYQSYKSAERVWGNLNREFGLVIDVQVVWVGGKKGWGVAIVKPKKWSWSRFNRFVGVIP